MAYETIVCEKRDSVGVIRLNRPDRMNAVCEEMYQELTDAFSDFGVDDSVRAVILTGSVRVKDGKEKQAFCAGADLKKHSSGDRDQGGKRRYISLAHDTTELMFNFPKPLIAAMNGPARGAGAEMALNCDFILMADGATIAFPETGLGTFVGGGVTWHLPILVGLMRAKELIYTGRVVDSRDGVRMGLALRACPLDSLMDEALALASTLAAKAPLSMAMAKSHLSETRNIDLHTALRLETDAILSCMDTEDWHEGIKAFMEKRTPEYKGK